MPYILFKNGKSLEISQSDLEYLNMLLLEKNSEYVKKVSIPNNKGTVQTFVDIQDISSISQNKPE